LPGQVGPPLPPPPRNIPPPRSRSRRQPRCRQKTIPLRRNTLRPVCPQRPRRHRPRLLRKCPRAILRPRLPRNQHLPRTPLLQRRSISRRHSQRPHRPRPIVIRRFRPLRLLANLRQADTRPRKARRLRRHFSLDNYSPVNGYWKFLRRVCNPVRRLPTSA
jgi:hypothetical protein